MSAKDCSSRDHCERRNSSARLLYAALLSVALALALALLILVVWLVLRPSKPEFHLQDASVYQLNLTAASPDNGPTLLTTVMQATLSSRNPNARVGVYYEELDAFAAYEGQRITAAVVLPSGYQGHGDTVAWSPFLHGIAVPVAPYLVAAIREGEAAGILLVNVRVEGRLRWKVGTWFSGHYHVQANCPALLAVGGAGDAAFRLQQIVSCSVDI